MRARFLKKGEDIKWFDLLGEESSRFFTQDADYRPESHMVVEKDDRFVGSMELIIEEPELLLLFNPKVKVIDALKLLVCKGIETAKSLDVQIIGCLIHESNKQFNIIEQLLPGLGFVFGMKKALYQLKPTSVSDVCVDCMLTYESLKQVAEGRFVEIFGKVYQPDIFESDAAKCFVDLKRRAANTKRFYPEDWEIAYIANKPVGITMPQLHDEMAQIGSNFLVGVVREERRKGIGKALQRRAVDTLIRRGAESIVGSTDIGNKPMLEIFESLGYELIEHQYFYRYYGMP
ncbi:GNAT family N-acetyltransferase [candidate division WOR-3 bacterium]|nr:GNAT family N-acetyltransferase [candidate division WOR-3 bacterium]